MMQPVGFIFIILTFNYVVSASEMRKENKSFYPQLGPINPKLDVEIGNVSYVFGIENVNWYEANAACTNITMQLLTLDNQEKDDEISQWLRDNPTYDSWKWLAARRETGAELFHWTTTGAALEYTHWGPQQPKPPPTLSMCADFSGDAEFWEDDNCEIFKLSYICEHMP